MKDIRICSTVIKVLHRKIGFSKKAPKAEKIKKVTDMNVMIKMLMQHFLKIT